MRWRAGPGFPFYSDNELRGAAAHAESERLGCATFEWILSSWIQGPGHTAPPRGRSEPL